MPSALRWSRSQVITNCEKIYVIWKYESRALERSFAGAIQSFNEKSVVSLREGALHLYILHITVKNSLEESRWAHISSGPTISEFLPISFEGTSFQSEDCRRIDRVDWLRVLHESISTCRAPLHRSGVTGFTVVTSDWVCLHLHLAIFSYVAGQPHAEDLTSAKCDVMTVCPCHSCLVRTKLMALYGAHPISNLKKSLALLPDVETVQRIVEMELIVVVSSRLWKPSQKYPCCHAPQCYFHFLLWVFILRLTRTLFSGWSLCTHCT